MKKNLSLFFYSWLIFSPVFSQLPTANFTVDINNVCPGNDSCSFNNLSTNATSYTWYFPGAIPQCDTSVVTNPTVYYNIPGQYNVTLIATNANGSDTLSLPNYINVYPFPHSLGMILSNDTISADPPVFASYQWYNSGVAIPGETDYFYVITQNGIYNVVCADSDGCQVEAVVFDVNLGVHESHDENGISVFPNPATENIYVRTDFPNNVSEMKIYSVLGELVLSIQNKNCADVSELLPGIYFVELKNGEKLWRNHFLKE